MPQPLINILSISSDVGSVYSGKSRAPDALFSSHLIPKLEQAGYATTTRSAFSNGKGKWAAISRVPNGARNEAATREACGIFKDEVSSLLHNKNESEFNLILAGECLYCPPILSAYWAHYGPQNKRVGMIYMDADCDLSTPAEPDSTGNIAGMTMTHLTLREGALESMKAFSKGDGKGVVDNSNFVLFGLNALSPANKRHHLGYLFDNSYRVFTSQGVALDPVRRAREALKWMEDRVDVILVHLDVDVIDPGEFPLGNVPNYTGLGFEQVVQALKVFLGSGETVGLSIAEVNPDHDPGLDMCRSLVDEVVDALKGRI